MTSFCMKCNAWLKWVNLFMHMETSQDVGRFHFVQNKFRKNFDPFEATVSIKKICGANQSTGFFVRGPL